VVKRERGSYVYGMSGSTAVADVECDCFVVADPAEVRLLDGDVAVCF